MTFLELAKKRFSVRSFADKTVEQEKLDMILEAGHVAPTACNFQPQRIYVVQSAEVREKLAAVCRFTFGAPVILVVCYDRTRDWKNKLMPGYESGETDAAIVCTHMMLEAEELGLGACWVGYFDAAKIAEALELPENVTVSAMLPLGYPAEDAKPLPLHSQFRDASEIVEYI
ncbi:MAG: nitroreductase family protein [Oscillospiraceae bacterium]|nr:nitroreductase family protein [Oscillospiraceae bacterium]